MPIFQHVPPYIPATLPTRISFVGEAPSDEEVMGGEPLIGPAGRIFNGAMRSANLDRKLFHITNVYDEQADDNDLTEFRKDATLTERNFQRLAAELATTRPNVIVPMGATALWAFTGQTAITPFRGAVTAATRIVPGAKLLPTFHPSFILRQWKFLPTLIGDFVKADKEATKGPKIIYPKVEIHLQPSKGDVSAWLQECKKSSLLSVDIETGWGAITCIGFAPDAHRAMCIPFVDLRKPNRSYWGSTDDEVQVWRMIKRTLEDASIPKLGQNFTYDAFWLLKKRGIRVHNYRHDTRLMHHALYPELPKDLAFMGATYTDFGAWKHMGGRYDGDKRDS